MLRKTNIFSLLLMAILLVITWLCYRPGLNGGFVFDDFANLPALGAEGPVVDEASFWRYITSGTADPLGRPIALLSFLIDAQDWPASPLSFKRTNLLLHLLNGVLLALLLRRLGLATCPEANAEEHRHNNNAAVLGASLWLLHPLLVSTTLYIVQREAMLPATFTLIGLLFWLNARGSFQRGDLSAGWGNACIGLGLCTTLAALSKANGILLPALVLTMEVFYLRPAAKYMALPTLPAGQRQYRYAMLCLAALPSIAVGTYLLLEGWQGLSHGISKVRPWTLEQRLLTEPRVLFEYLRLLWLPHPFTAGVFNDQFKVSTSLWSPLTTLPAMAGVVGLLAGAIAWRNKIPTLALAIGFYFVGQSMESSTIPLELYYEHRNYLPAIFMFWPLAQWLYSVGIRPAKASSPHSGDHGRHRRAMVALLTVGGLAAMTHARAELWGNTHEQALLWAKLNPHSPRAQAYAAQAEMAANQPERAIMRLAPALARDPDEVQLALNLLAAECQRGGIDRGTLDAAIKALSSTHDTGTLLANWFGRILDQSHTPACPQLDLAGVATLLDAALQNPHLTVIPNRRQDLYYLYGRIALLRHEPSVALASFDYALDQQVRATIAFQQAALLGAAGYPEQGLAHLDRYEAERQEEYSPPLGMARVHTWVLNRQNYWDRELVRLRRTLLNDAQNHHSSSDPA